MTKQYILNLETSKIELLHFSKEEYKSLTTDEQKSIRRAYMFAGSRSAWVSRSTKNHYSAISVAKQLGFTDGGKIGERLSYAEKVERQVEKAEARIDRYEKYADNAETRAKNLQKDINSMHGDIAFLRNRLLQDMPEVNGLRVKEKKCLTVIIKDLKSTVRVNISGIKLRLQNKQQV